MYILKSGFFSQQMTKHLSDLRFNVITRYCIVQRKPLLTQAKLSQKAMESHNGGPHAIYNRANHFQPNN